MRLEARFIAVGILAAVPGCVQASAPSEPQKPVATADPAKPADTQPKVVCKRVPVVGSNVGTERVCTVRGESKKPSDGQSRPTADPQERSGSNNGS